nr:immunoglobulin light chain junction region [Macaca mulatta]
CQMYSSSPFTF